MVPAAAVFRAGVTQMMRNRLIAFPLGLSALFPVLLAFLVTKIPGPSEGGPPAAEAAMGVVFMAIPMAATIATGFVMILGSSLLPEEISAGRAGYWISQPVSRRDYMVGMTLASLAVSLAITAILFHGSWLATVAILGYPPADTAAAVLAPMCWTTVNLALVTLLSLVLPRLAAVILSLGLAGMANFLGGLGQVAGAIPEGPPADVFRTSALVSFLVFPADPMLRLALYGMKPAVSMAEEMMVFMGVTTRPPVWMWLYSAAWTAGAWVLSLLRFRRLDLS
jgi:ABC-type transport system involved in multi-copper enzyme maturation permease subunit